MTPDPSGVPAAISMCSVDECEDTAPKATAAEMASAFQQASRAVNAAMRKYFPALAAMADAQAALVVAAERHAIRERQRENARNFRRALRAARGRRR